MANETPVGEVLEFIKKGLSNEEITKQLEVKGFNLQQISDAINQAKIKEGVEGNMPEQNMQEQQQSMEQDIPLPQGQPEGQVQSPGVTEVQGGMQEQYQQQEQYPPQQAYPQQSQSYGDMQALVEQIIEEKWQAAMKDMGDVRVFKARVSDDMEAVKQELVRTQKRLEDLQVAVMGKVKDYSDGVVKIGSDMKALEKGFTKIMEPLTLNVKELGRISEEFKGHHKRKK